MEGMRAVCTLSRKFCSQKQFLKKDSANWHVVQSLDAKLQKLAILSKKYTFISLVLTFPGRVEIIIRFNNVFFIFLQTMI